MQVPVKSLLAELQWAQRFVGAKVTVPILSTVLFRSEGNRLTLTTTDLEVGGITYVDGKGRGGRKSWTVAAPAKKLIQYLQKVDEEEVTLSVEDWKLNVIHGTARMRVSGMSEESFPELPKMPDETFTIDGLAQAIDRTMFAISAEESRFTLNGALLDVANGASRLIATDGHRIALAPVKVSGCDKARALLPKSVLVEAGKMDETCRFARDEDHACLDYGRRRIVGRLLKGNFPDWERVRPQEFANHVMLPPAETLKILNRVALCADLRSRAIRFRINSEGGDGPRLTIFASTVDTGEAEGHLQVKLGVIASPLEAGYNADYLTGFLSRVTDYGHVAFCWTDAKSAAMLTTGDGFEYLCMPMRIK